MINVLLLLYYYLVDISLFNKHQFFDLPEVRKLLKYLIYQYYPRVHMAALDSVGW